METKTMFGPVDLEGKDLVLLIAGDGDRIGEDIHYGKLDELKEIIEDKLADLEESEKEYFLNDCCSIGIYQALENAEITATNNVTVELGDRAFSEEKEVFRIFRTDNGREVETDLQEHEIEETLQDYIRDNDGREDLFGIERIVTYECTYDVETEKEIHIRIPDQTMEVVMITKEPEIKNPMDMSVEEIDKEFAFISARIDVLSRAKNYKMLSPLDELATALPPAEFTDEDKYNNG